MTGIIVKISELSVTRGNTNILRSINWEVLDREHWVILGGNGSGKTSLLSALTGYLMPSAGEIQLLGKDYGSYDWRELRKQVGIVSSAIRQMIPDEETALETVLSGLSAQIGNWTKRQQPEEIRKARRILRQTGNLPLADRPWRVLSQGERQRILIARALITDPALLILDEPCAGLDPAARERFLQFVQSLCEKPDGPTLLLVTHHIEEITPAFTKVLILKNGRMFQSGSKEKGG